MRYAMHHMSTLEAASAYNVCLTCTNAYDELAYDELWLSYSGFALYGSSPDHFCFLACHARFQQQQDADWKKNLLTGRVVEGRQTNKLTWLAISMDIGTSREHWGSQCMQSLVCSRMPTTVQAAEVEATSLVLVREFEVSAACLLRMALEQPTSNAILTTLLMAKLWLEETITKEAQPDLGKRKREALPDDEFKGLAAQCMVDVAAVQQGVAFMSGLGVDQVKADKWVLKGVPQGFRIMVAKALAKLGWRQLSDMFKRRGLMKSIVRALHLNQHTAKVSDKGDRARLQLALRVLHEEKYPSSEEEYVKRQWNEQVTIPLQEVCLDDRFCTEAQWLESAWVPSLAGQKLKPPEQRIVEHMLSRHRNTPETWQEMLQAGLVTPSQLLNNLRSLVYLDIPTSLVEGSLLSSADPLPVSALLRVHHLLVQTFTPQHLTAVAEGFALGAETLHKADAGAPGGSSGEWRTINLPEALFKDKLGQVHARAPHKVVSRSFGEATVEAYKAMLERLLVTAGDTATSGMPANTTAIVVHSPELQNVIRTGVPPSIPAYSKSSLWRHERVHLQQLLQGEEEAPVLQAGISWTEAPGQSHVDLDLSVILYDADWQMMDQCSYTNLEIDGVKHSGDLTSAPPPHGARETVNIEVSKMQERGVSKAAIVVFAYSGQNMDDLADASIFVGNPQLAGRGPGGTHVLSAARLSGKGKANIGGYLEFHDDGTTSFVCCDHTLNTSKGMMNGISVETANHMIGGILSSTVKINQSPSGTPLLNVALMHSVMMSSKVIVITAEGLVEHSRSHSENSVEAYTHLLGLLQASTPCVYPSFDFATSNATSKTPLLAGKVVIFGGELQRGESFAEVEDHRPYAQQGKIIYVNMRSDAEKVETVPLESVDGELTVVHGWDALEPLTEILKQ